MRCPKCNEVKNQLYIKDKQSTISCGPCDVLANDEYTLINKTICSHRASPCIDIENIIYILREES